MEDINDSSPIFEDSSTIRFSEDTLPGEIIHTLKAYDPDLDNAVQYSIVGGDSNTFTIDSSSGELSLLHTVDRELEETFQLMVRASDGVHQTDIKIILAVSYLFFFFHTRDSQTSFNCMSSL